RLVGDDRHAARADLLVAQDDVQRLHEGHGGAELALAGALEQALEGFQLRYLQLHAGLAPALRQEAAEPGPALLHVLHLGRIRARVVEGHLRQLLVRNRDVEAVAEGAHGLVVQLLGLVGRVERLAGAAHAVALDRLGQDHRRLAGVVHRRVVGGVDLVRVMAAAVQAPDVLVAEVGDQLAGLRVLAEEMLARVGAAEGLAVLVLAVDGFHHQLAQHALVVARQQRIPVAAPDQLDDVPAGAPEAAFQFLDDLAVAAHRAVQALQVAVDDEDQVVQALAAGQGDGAQALGLVRLAVAEEAPDLAVALGHQAAGFHVLEEARLVDGADRAQAHGHGRELPVVRHQPGMRVAGNTLAVDFHAEVVQLAFADAALEEAAGIDARRAVALDVDQVARMLLAGRAPEVVEADVVEGGAGGEAGDVAAQVARLAVGAHHHGHGVPADQAADAPFHGRITVALGLQVRRDGVGVRGGRMEGQRRAGPARQLGHAFQQLVGALGTVVVQHRLQRLHPLPGLGRIGIVFKYVVEPVHVLSWAAWRRFLGWIFEPMEFTPPRPGGARAGVNGRGGFRSGRAAEGAPGARAQERGSRYRRQARPKAAALAAQPAHPACALVQPGQHPAAAFGRPGVLRGAAGGAGAAGPGRVAQPVRTVRPWPAG